MKSLLILIFTFLLSCIYMAYGQETVGGLTLLEWNKKCTKYFKESGDPANEKAFLIPGQCEQYVCQKYKKNTYGMRIDECQTRFMNGIPCKTVLKTDETFPNCCKYKCQ